jgi:hypothetical protein
MNSTGLRGGADAAGRRAHRRRRVGRKHARRADRLDGATAPRRRRTTHHQADPTVRWAWVRTNNFQIMTASLGNPCSVSDECTGSSKKRSRARRTQDLRLCKLSLSKWPARPGHPLTVLPKLPRRVPMRCRSAGCGRRSPQRGLPAQSVPSPGC